MLGRRPLAHIISAFRDQTQYRVWTESIDLDRIHGSASDLLPAEYKVRHARRIVTHSDSLHAGPQAKAFWACHNRRSAVQSGINLGTAFSDLYLVELIQLQCLPQCQNVLGTTITSERGTDGLWRSGAADIAMLSLLFGRGSRTR
jgi:hypothetical protein